VHPIRDRFIYAATKGAVCTMTTSLASDFVLDGIRQCALSLAHSCPVDGLLALAFPKSHGRIT
jgi:hypothetical protein